MKRRARHRISAQAEVSPPPIVRFDGSVEHARWDRCLTPLQADSARGCQTGEPELIDDEDVTPEVDDGELSLILEMESTDGAPPVIVRAQSAGPSAAGSKAMWGGGTTGIPRKGSRSIRLFRADLETVASMVSQFRFGSLRLSGLDWSNSGGRPELRGHGRLDGAFAMRPGTVDVSVRVARFNPRFTAVELTLESRGHPRRFFRAAHDAIEELKQTVR